MACDYGSLIRIGKWSTHSFVDSPPAESAPWPLRFSNVNIGVNIEGKVERTNSYDSNHIDKQDHLCFHLCIHLHMGGNTEVDMERSSLLSILLVSVQALDNKLDGLRACISFQLDSLRLG